jgi:DNA-binding transcriptional ArsR family regulator
LSFFQKSNKNFIESLFFNIEDCFVPRNDAGMKKIFSKKFAQLIGCIYICSQSTAYNMRRDIFQAIADPTRRAILGLLALGAMTPNAVAEHFDSTRQTISKHIQILTECEVVIQKKSGREIHYHFNPEKMKEIDIWLDRFRKMWEDSFDQLDDVLNDL